MRKSEAKHNWSRYGLNPNDFEKAWSAYCNSTRCDWCTNKYKTNRDKQMDHCHQDDDYYEKGDFRNILCKMCNSWRHNSPNICKVWHKQRNKYIYDIHVKRNGKYILRTSRNNYEEAEAVLLNFKKNNGFYFPFYNSQNNSI